MPEMDYEDDQQILAGVGKHHQLVTSVQERERKTAKFDCSVPTSIFSTIHYWLPQQNHNPRRHRHRRNHNRQNSTWMSSILYVVSGMAHKKKVQNCGKKCSNIVPVYCWFCGSDQRVNGWWKNQPETLLFVNLPLSFLLFVVTSWCNAFYVAIKSLHHWL